MKNSISFLLVFFFTGCTLATTLSSGKVDNSLYMSYDLFYNNRTARHKPAEISVSAQKVIAKKIIYSRLYRFYINSNKVEKRETSGGKRVKLYLVLDSTGFVNENLFSVSQQEFEIFEKVIYYSDSLHLKDFNFLKKAKGFKLIPEN